MRKFAIFTLVLALGAVLLVGCGCMNTETDVPTLPTNGETVTPTHATQAPSTEATTMPTTMPTTGATDGSTDSTGAMDGTMDSILGTDGANGNGGSNGSGGANGNGGSNGNAGGTTVPGRSGGMMTGR